MKAAQSVELAYSDFRFQMCLADAEYAMGCSDKNISPYNLTTEHFYGLNMSSAMASPIMRIGEELSALETIFALS